MARPKSLAPAYCHHKQSGRAYVALDGRQHMLPGPHGTEESRGAYDRLVAEWLSNGRTMTAAPSTGATVSMVALAFWKYAQAHYVDAAGAPTGEAENYRLALRGLRRMYGTIPAVSFGPKRLKMLRQAMTAERDGKDEATGAAVATPGWCRNYANRQTKRIQQVFRWAASEELIPASVPAALDTVTGLRAGAAGVRESEPVEAVADDVVDATLSYLPPPVKAMVQLQRLVGARGGELFILRTCDVDTTGAVWKYNPPKHKTAYKGHVRTIYFGPQAQDVLRPFLRSDLQANLFQPAEAAAWRNERQKARRKTPMTPAHLKRAEKAKGRTRRHHTRYTKDVYARAVARACDSAFPPPAELARQKGEGRRAWLARLTPDQRAALAKWRSDHRWHPHQLRHSAATTFRREADFESAKIILGHRTDSMTQNYAERDARKAEEVIARIG